jgi:outer membrane receptor protein involved in Fe transport
MKRNRNSLRAIGIGPLRAALLAAAPIAIAVPGSLPAWAQTQSHTFSIESQPLSSALLSLGRQADISVLAPTTLTDGKVSRAVEGQLSVSAALDRMLEGTGLSYTFVQSNAVRIILKDQAELLPSDAPSDLVPAERVVVTGTTIAGLAPAGSPVDVYTREDIARSGATTTEQFVGKLPQNLGTLSQYAVGASTTGSNLDAVTAIDLRGLGVGTTLTLLNGRRMALSNSGTSSDVSFIPANAIERVEVLTDGASAIYGSDAVGGVVNFILRDDYDGAETRLAAGGVTRGGMRQLDAGQTFGGRWNGGHGILAYDFHSASALKTGDRSYAAAAGPGNLTPVDTRHNLFGAASQAITDRITLDASAGTGWRKVKNTYSNLSSPTPAGQTVVNYQSQSDQVFANVGLNWEITNDLSADVTASYAEVDTDGIISLTAFNLVPPVTTDSDFNSRNSQLDLAAKLSGALFPLPGGDLRFSVGAGVLEEEYRGVNPNSNAQTAGTLGRRSPYVFGEIFAPLVGPGQGIPLVRNLSVSLAARYTDYQETSEPDYGFDFGSSTDPKIGILWSPTESWSVRGTYGSSFRAPSLTQLDPAGGLHYLFPLTVGGAPSIVLGMVGYPVSDLGPETADTYTVGLDYEPKGSNLRFSVTYYNIDYSNRIGTAPAGGLNPFVTPAALPDLIYRPPSEAFIEEALRATPLLVNLSGVDVSDPAAGAATLFARSDVWMYDVRFRNLATSKQDGFDLSFSDMLETAWGDLRLGANATHIISYKQQGSASSSVMDAVDVPGQPVDWRGRAYGGLSNGPFTGTLSVNYVDDYTNPLAPAGQQKIDSWTTFDLNLTYELDRLGPFQKSRFSLSVQNLFDEDPPHLDPGAGSNIIYPVGFDPANANPLGRFIVFGLTQTW